MKALGYLLVVGGFLAASLAAVQQVEGVPLEGYFGGLIAGIVGVALIRTATRRTARSEDTLSSNIGTLSQSLEGIVERVARLEQEGDETDVYELRHRIDAEFPELLNGFVQARESIGHRFGLNDYAEVMNPFAAGERYLNRVWSASTDGYIDEARTYLTKSREQFEEARRILEGLRNG